MRAGFLKLVMAYSCLVLGCESLKPKPTDPSLMQTTGKPTAEDEVDPWTNELRPATGERRIEKEYDWLSSSRAKEINRSLGVE